MSFHLVKWPLTLVQGQWPKISFSQISRKKMRDRDFICIVHLLEITHGLSSGEMTFDLGAQGQWPKMSFSEISHKQWEIETSFVLYTYRKSHMGFHLVKWPLILVQGKWPKKSFSQISRKQWGIETSFVLYTYRKSHMGFHLVKWPLTLVANHI